MNKLYSYQRWSSAVQSKGSSSRRQMAMAEKFANDNGLDLVETITDDGISSFHGKNVENGALGQFITAVESGLIDRGSWLFVENLDRISRNTASYAMGLFLRIINLDITIVTGMDGKIYSRETVDENNFDLIFSILLFSRAHEESKTKRIRKISSVKLQIERFNSGLPTTINSIGKTPWWIDSKTKPDEAVRKHPVLFPIAQEVVRMLIDGKSIYSISKFLNHEYPLINGTEWKVGSIRDMSKSVSLYGNRLINLDGKDYILENYYPALISEPEFIRIQENKKNHRYIGNVSEKKNNINLLAGLGKFNCGHCGSYMMAFKQGGKIRYICGKGRIGKSLGCFKWSVAGELVEHLLCIVLSIAYVINVTRGNTQKKNYDNELRQTREDISDCTDKISRLVGLVQNGFGDMKEITDSLDSLKKERESLLLKESELKRKQALSDGMSMNDLLLEFYKNVKYDIITDVMSDKRYFIRELVSEFIDCVYGFKEDKKIKLMFRTKGEELFYTFKAAENDKRYSVSYDEFTEPGVDYGISDDVLGNFKEILRSGVNKEIKELFERKDFLFKEAVDLLSIVGFPEVNGDLFWPKK